MFADNVNVIHYFFEPLIVNIFHYFFWPLIDNIIQDFVALISKDLTLLHFASKVFVICRKKLDFADLVILTKVK